MNQRDIENIVDSEVSIDGKDWHDSEMRALWAKNEMIFRHMSDYWRPLIVDGKKCMNFLLGEIFEPQVRTQYETVQNKICIEPRVMKPRINTIVGRIKGSQRRGKISVEGSKDSNEVYRANIILKYFGKTIEEQAKLNQMLFTGCVTGCPQVMVFDFAETSYGAPIGGITAEVPDWDSYMLSPGFRDPSGRDNHEFVRMVRQTKQEMIDQNPDREDEIKEHYSRMQDKSYVGMLENTFGLTVEDARYLSYDIITGVTHSAFDGRCLVLERWFPTKAKTAVAISRVPQSVAALDYQILPGTWERKRKEQWISQHPEYQLVEKEVTILWQTRWTREGLMLMHKPHLFQESYDNGMPVLPLGVFVPQVIDGVPTGPGPDMRPLILMKAIADTEELHDIRRGSGDVLAYMKGHIANAADLPTELATGDAIIQVDPDESISIDNSVKFLQRRTNDSYGEYSQKVNQQLSETDLVTPDMQVERYAKNGGTGAGKGFDISGVVAYSFYSENFNRSLEQIRNIECMLIPYAFTDEQELSLHDDDTGEDVAIVVNETEYDMEGNPLVNPASDLSSAKWKWTLSEGDDSPTARQQEINEMLVFWNTTAPALIEIDPSLGTLASMLMSMANQTAKEIGRILAQKAQVNAQAMSQQQMMESIAKMEEAKGKSDAVKIKAMRAGFSFSITPDDLAKHPEVFQMLVDRQYLNPSSYQFQMPPAPAGQQDPGAGGGMPGQQPEMAPGMSPQQM